MAMLVYQRVIPMLLRSMFHLKMERSILESVFPSIVRIRQDMELSCQARHLPGRCLPSRWNHPVIWGWFPGRFGPGKLISSPTTMDTTIDAVAWSHKNWFNYKENSATEKWPANLGPIEETFKRNEPYPRDSRLLSNHWCKHSQLHGRKGSYLGPDVETSGCSRQHIVCVHL